VRGEGRKVLLDRLVVADIGENRIEHGIFRAIGGNRNSGLRHQRQQAYRLQRHCLAAGVGPVMTNCRWSPFEFHGDWDYGYTFEL